MKINILEIMERSAYYISKSGGRISSQFISLDDMMCIIIPERNFMELFMSNENSNTKVAGIYDLGECYSPCVDLRFSLYILKENNIENINTSIYKESLYAKNRVQKYKTNGKIISMPNEYPDSFLYYLEDLEKWINENIEPAESFYGSYNEIKADEYLENEPFSSRYSKRSILIYEKLKKEKIVNLYELADIIVPDENNLIDAPVTYLWNFEEFKYPLDSSYFRKINYGSVINFPLQKGDIMLCSTLEGYQVNIIPEELTTQVYCPALTTIIRTKKDISPYYLFLYLHSEVGKIIIGDRINGEVIKKLTKEEIENLPIIRPVKSGKQYEKLFNEIYIKQYKLDVFSDCYRKQIVDSIEDMLNDELISKTKKCRSNLAKEIIDADIEEMKNCFEVKAYKATLIMAGSVMEAVLTDWLSEIEDVDYFKEKIVNADGSEAKLRDIINRIKILKAPAWMEEAENAHEIRRKRNLVHAKLCLGEKEKINASTCKKVIKYLTQIIETRYKNKEL